MDEITKKAYISQLKKSIGSIRDDIDRLNALLRDEEDALALLIGPFQVGDITESRPNSRMYKWRHVVIKVGLYDSMSRGDYKQRVWMRKIKKDGTVGSDVIDHTWTEEHEKVGHMELTEEQRRTR